MSNTISIQDVHQRISNATSSLVRSDLENPDNKLSESQIRANPYRVLPGSDGNVDKNEAASVNDPFVQSLFETTATEKSNTVTSMPDGSSTIVPEWSVSHGEIRRLSDHIQLIVTRLDQDGDGQLKPEDLERIDETIQSFYDEIYPSHFKPEPQFIQRVSSLVRQVCAFPETIQE